MRKMFSLLAVLSLASLAGIMTTRSALAGEYYYGDGYYGHHHHGSYSYRTCCYERIVKYRRVYSDHYGPYRGYNGYRYGSYDGYRYNGYDGYRPTYYAPRYYGPRYYTYSDPGPYYYGD